MEMRRVKKEIRGPQLKYEGFPASGSPEEREMLDSLKAQNLSEDEALHYVQQLRQDVRPKMVIRSGDVVKTFELKGTDRDPWLLIVSTSGIEGLTRKSNTDAVKM